MTKFRSLTSSLPVGIFALLAGFAVLAASCSDASNNSTSAAGDTLPARPNGDLVDSTGAAFLTAPDVKTGELSPELKDDLDLAFGSLSGGEPLADAVLRVGESGDVRVAWLLADLMRFVPAGSGTAVAVAYENLTGIPLTEQYNWKVSTDALIAWDIPAPPGYVDWKRIPFEQVDDRWAPFFDDTEANIDWRVYSWGGVLMDDRARDNVVNVCAQGCIPAINDPELISAEEGTWYGDDRIIFGVEINDEAVAFPKNIMEIHEMVNTTIGGRRIAIPYCTLCGSAQAYVTDNVEGFDTLEIRTSGLLARSNKVMFDLDSFSVFDTFTGEALSGPLREAGVQLEQLTVVTSTWGDWKIAHPNTTIISEDGGISRSYADDPLRGRDDNGPIFPVGDVDTRAGVQDSVIGVLSADGTPLAFPAEEVRTAIANGETPGLAGITIVADGGGFRAENADGEQVTAHQSFWFAWSQFHPDTLVWTS